MPFFIGAGGLYGGIPHFEFGEVVPEVAAITGEKPVRVNLGVRADQKVGKDASGSLPLPG